MAEPFGRVGALQQTPHTARSTRLQNARRIFEYCENSVLQCSYSAQSGCDEIGFGRVRLSAKPLPEYKPFHYPNVLAFAKVQLQHFENGPQVVVCIA